MEFRTRSDWVRSSRSGSPPSVAAGLVTGVLAVNGTDIPDGCGVPGLRELFGGVGSGADDRFIT